MGTDPTKVFFTDQKAARVYSCPLTGCKPKPFIIAPAEDAPSGLVVDGAQVYFANNGIGSDVRRCTKDGASCISLATNQLHPLNLVVDDKYVYWTDVGTFTPMFINMDGSIHRAPK